ncbi:hypothetical protein [Sphingobacterium sp. BN32]|uniref:hypothetical protein n=1 Tax=Sphingobacterium sp. BN32 TaxID=3058432 RepID=UPI00265D2021|nr:hypothetical protein [Sphingobacterium sp. BN32]WKK56997.1 hypothetical protein QYC40_10085 [Sphingobacterium sp. BN32]
MLIPDFYTVLQSNLTETQVDAQIKLNAQHPIFQGHFPDNPVTPGVCMLQICKELTETATNKSLKISSCKNVKFTALINPFTDPELQINLAIKSESSSYKISGTAYFGDTLAIKISALLTA